MSINRKGGATVCDVAGCGYVCDRRVLSARGRRGCVFGSKLLFCLILPEGRLLVIIGPSKAIL